MKRRRTILVLVTIMMFLVANTSMTFAADTGQVIKLKYTAISVTKGGTTRNTLIGAAGKVIWKSSNKKIATISSKGKIKGKRIGKCTITAKYKGKIYKCKVKVKRVQPNFDAKIVAVKEAKKKKIIKVRFYNHSGRTLTIMQKASYKDLTKTKYLFKLKKAQIKIPPHKNKTLTFYNYGSKELWNFAGRQDPDIFAEALESKFFYKFKFDGKKYSGKTFWDYEEDDETNQWIDYYDSVYGDGIPTDAELR